MNPITIKANDVELITVDEMPADREELENLLWVTAQNAKMATRHHYEAAYAAAFEDIKAQIVADNPPTTGETLVLAMTKALEATTKVLDSTMQPAATKYAGAMTRGGVDVDLRSSPRRVIERDEHGQITAIVDAPAVADA